MEEKFVNKKTKVQSEMDKLKQMIESLQADVVVLKKVVLHRCPTLNAYASPKVRVHEPKSFSGNHNAKELENFLWDMDQFLKVARVPEVEKVSITSMYLIGDAKLWWRTQVGEDSGIGRLEVAEWGTLKKELKDHFLLTNVVWIVRESLKRLKHTGLV